MLVGGAQVWPLAVLHRRLIIWSWLSTFKCMMLQHMSDAALGEVVRRTMETADVDRDGRIPFEELLTGKCLCCLRHFLLQVFGAPTSRHLQSCALVPWDSLTVPVMSSSRQQVEIEVAMANAAQQNRFSAGTIFRDKRCGFSAG